MSDHISGPRALAEPIADITDVYAFPSPEQPGHLVMVMNTMPFAQPSDAFSEGLVYRFRIRAPNVANGTGRGLFAVAADELTLDCVFSEPSTTGEPGSQSGSCTLPSGDEVSFRVNDPQGGMAGGVRVFAGARWDPFIMDAPAALKTISTGRLAFTEQGAIYLDGKSVLGLVVEIDCTRVLGAHVELVAVVAETLTRGRHNVRIERVGRPEVKNMMLAPKQFDPINRDLEIRDLYNMEDAFHLADGYLGAYRTRLNANLSFWDSLDGKVDWTLDAAGTHPLTELILDDFLVVDVGKPYAEQGSFFEIERAALEDRPHQTCGGRTLNDDVMDTIFTLLINAGTGPTIRDGVDCATRPGSRSFPYLAEPTASPPKLPAHH